MTVADLDNLKTPLEESEKIQEALKVLGYEVHGFRRKRHNEFYFDLYLHFVGPSFYTGDKSSPPVPPTL